MKKNEKASNATYERKAQHPMIYWMTVITLVIIVLAFVIFPSFSRNTTVQREGYIGTYGGEIITQDVNSFYNSTMKTAYQRAEYQAYQYSMQNEGMEYDQILNYFTSNVPSQSKDATIQAYGIKDLLKQTGIAVSSAKEYNLIQQNCGDINIGADYRAQGGTPNKTNFSVKKYNLAKGRNNRKVNAAKRNVSMRYMAQNFMQDISTISSFSDAEKAFIEEMNKERLSMSYFKVTDDMISSEDLIKFTEKNIENFIELDLRMLRIGSKKQAKEVLAEINETPDLFIEKAEVFNSPAQIKKKGRIAGFCSDIENKLNLDESTVKIVSNLQLGEISKILKVNDFFYIFKAESDPLVKESSALLANKKEDILKTLRKDDGDLYRTLLEDASKSIRAEAIDKGFEIVATSKSAEIKKLEDFPLNFNNSSMLEGLTDTSLSTNEPFLRDIFSTEEGSIIEPLQSGMDILICKVDSRSVSDAGASINEVKATEDMLINYVTNSKRYKPAEAQVQ